MDALWFWYDGEWQDEIEVEDEPDEFEFLYLSQVVGRLMWRHGSR